MRHDWIFDVLADLRAYADQNNLPALAEQVAAALRVAELEIGVETPHSMSKRGSVAGAAMEKRRRIH
jgi:hypothetical protein